MVEKKAEHGQRRHCHQRQVWTAAESLVGKVKR